MAGPIDLNAVLAMVVAAIPVAIVLGTALLLAVGGIIGCTRCVVAALGSARWSSDSVPETEPRMTAEHLTA